MITHPELDALNDLWIEKCAGRAVPAPTDIDASMPTNWCDHAGWIVVEDDDPRFRIRWVGAWLRARWNVPGTLGNPEEVGGEIGAILCADLVRASRLKAPIFTLRPPFAAFEETQYSEMILPLSSDGEIVDVLLVAGYHLPKSH